MAKLILPLLVLLTFNSFAQISVDSLVAYFPFNGNADDFRDYNNNGEVNGAILTSDRFGRENSAYLFNGINDFIGVKSAPQLNNISESITISAWVKPRSKYYNAVVAFGSQNILLDFAK